MYSDVSELPSQVMLALGPEGASEWMRAYNAASGDARGRRRSAWEACAELPSSYSFEMIATADRPDRDGEIMDVGDIERCMDSYIERGGPVQLDHGNYTVGTVWGWSPTKASGRDAIAIRGNLYGGGGVYERVRSEFARGLRGASVAGEAGPARRVCDDSGCAMHRGVKELMEISICRVPSNPAAVLLSHHPADAPRPFSKSLDLTVESVDMKGCPVKALASRLRSCGVPCVVTSDGPVVPMSSAEFAVMVPAFAACGLSARWLDSRGGAAVEDKADSFASLVDSSAEWLDSDAEGLVLSDSAPDSVRESLRDAGLLADDGRVGMFSTADALADALSTRFFYNPRCDSAGMDTDEAWELFRRTQTERFAKSADADTLASMIQKLSADIAALNAKVDGMSAGGAPPGGAMGGLGDLGGGDLGGGLGGDDALGAPGMGGGEGAPGPADALGAPAEGAPGEEESMDKSGDDDDWSWLDDILGSSEEAPAAPAAPSAPMGAPGRADDMGLPDDGVVDSDDGTEVVEGAGQAGKSPEGEPTLASETVGGEDPLLAVMPRFKEAMAAKAELLAQSGDFGALNKVADAVARVEDVAGSEQIMKSARGAKQPMAAEARVRKRTADQQDNDGRHLPTEEPDGANGRVRTANAPGALNNRQVGESQPSAGAARDYKGDDSYSDGSPEERIENAEGWFAKHADMSFREAFANAEAGVPFDKGSSFAKSASGGAGSVAKDMRRVAPEMRRAAAHNLHDSHIAERAAYDRLKGMKKGDEGREDAMNEWEDSRDANSDAFNDYIGASNTERKMKYVNHDWNRLDDNDYGLGNTLPTLPDSEYHKYAKSAADGGSFEKVGWTPDDVQAQRMAARSADAKYRRTSDAVDAYNEAERRYDANSARLDGDGPMFDRYDYTRLPLAEMRSAAIDSRGAYRGVASPGPTDFVMVPEGQEGAADTPVPDDETLRGMAGKVGDDIEVKRQVRSKASEKAPEKKKQKQEQEDEDEEPAKAQRAGGTSKKDDAVPVQKSYTIRDAFAKKCACNKSFAMSDDMDGESQVPEAPASDDFKDVPSASVAKDMRKVAPEMERAAHHRVHDTGGAEEAARDRARSMYPSDDDYDDALDDWGDKLDAYSDAIDDWNGASDTEHEVWYGGHGSMLPDDEPHVDRSRNTIYDDRMKGAYINDDDAAIHSAWEDKIDRAYADSGENDDEDWTSGLGMEPHDLLGDAAYGVRKSFKGASPSAAVSRPPAGAMVNGGGAPVSDPRAFAKSAPDYGDDFAARLRGAVQRDWAEYKAYKSQGY